MLRRHRTPPERPCVPDGIRLYVIGDIHGRLDLLDGKLNDIMDDVSQRRRAHNRIIFLGDYIDRGPDSRGVICRLIEIGKRADVVTLMGNHEATLLRTLDDPLHLPWWSANGGALTLLSYGLAPSMTRRQEESVDAIKGLRSAVPAEHLEFVRSLPLSFECGDYFFVHAGIRPRVRLEDQQADDLLWIRDEFLNSRVSHPKIVVHGHTPVPLPEVRRNRINVDLGAFATGRLCCLVLEADQQNFI